MQDMLLRFNGQSVMADCSVHSGQLYIDAANGNRTILNVDDVYYKSKDGQIPVYYYDSVRNAKPMTFWGFWCFSYLFSGSIVAVSVYRIWKIYGKSGRHGAVAE